jgi:cytochrome c oxidase subunit 3
MFSGLIAAFIHFKVVSPGETAVLDVTLTTINTFLLLTSSFVAVTALTAIRRGDIQTTGRNLIIAGFLGLAFIMGQALEFNSLALQGITLHVIFGASFYALTGFHGLHVFVGCVWIVFLTWALYRVQAVKEEHVSWVEVFGLYWAFVDLIWMILFTIIYLIR